LKVKKGTPPEPPTAAEMDAFLQNGSQGPSIANPSFDWLRPFSSPWNNSMVFKLAKDFKETVLKDPKKVPHDPKWDNENYLTEVIPRKLARVRRRYIESLPPGSGTLVTQEQKQAALVARRQGDGKMNRRASRRHGVRVTPGTGITLTVSTDFHPEGPDNKGEVSRRYTPLGSG
jgi:hypothetical protein